MDKSIYEGNTLAANMEIIWQTTISIGYHYICICDWLWEKGHIRANNDFSV